MKKLSSLSVVFPAYNDEKSIPVLLRKTIRLLPRVAKKYEIIVVNDASVDDTGKRLYALQQKTPFLKVITHKKNQGYGGVLLDGFKKATKEHIFYTDGDGQYDVTELQKLVAVFDETCDMVSGFKIARSDPWFRKTVGTIYNQAVRLLFDLPVRDVDCDFRLFRRNILKRMRFTIKSGTFDAQFMWQCKQKKVRIKEVPVHHYARPYGSSQFFTLPRLFASMRDLLSFWAYTQSV